MVLANSRKIEVLFNEYTNKEHSGKTGYPLKSLERIVLYDGEEVYRDKLGVQLYLQDKSLLHQFENWVTGSGFLFEKFQGSCNIGCDRCNERCLFRIFRFKFFGKIFKFKT